MYLLSLLYTSSVLVFALAIDKSARQRKSGEGR